MDKFKLLEIMESAYYQRKLLSDLSYTKDQCAEEICALSPNMGRERILGSIGRICDPINSQINCFHNKIDRSC